MSNKSKGPNTEITKDLGGLFSADVEVLSCDLSSSSTCSRDLFCKGGKTGIPVDQKEVGDRGRETGEDSWTSLSWTCESGERHSTGLVEMRISEDKIRY